MNKYFIALTLISTAMTTSIANAAMIDDFEGGNQLIWSGSSGSVLYGAAFGGNREIDITSSGSQFYHASAIVEEGVFKHNAISGYNANSTISWATSVGTSVDLTDADTSYGFALDILSIDQGNVDFTLDVFDALGNHNYSTLSNVGIGVQFIAFTLFSDIDFSQVNGISLLIEGDVASDLTLDSISTVPAPPAVILLTSGLAALGFSRRKLIA